MLRELEHARAETELVKFMRVSAVGRVGCFYYRAFDTVSAPHVFEIYEQNRMDDVCQVPSSERIQYEVSGAHCSYSAPSAHCFHLIVALLNPIFDHIPDHIPDHISDHILDPIFDHILDHYF
ncbi:hypothetical protein FHG87_020738 [Trinorchestia longiramus]|nr:hypothetical protein FHG87_020738 [Trinorchestia longiramus]